MGAGHRWDLPRPIQTFQRLTRCLRHVVGSAKTGLESHKTPLNLLTPALLSGPGEAQGADKCHSKAQGIEHYFTESDSAADPMAFAANAYKYLSTLEF